MTGRGDHGELVDAMGALSVAAGEVAERQLTMRRERPVGDATRSKLQDEIANNYETVFSWRIKELTGVPSNIMKDILSSLREKRDLIVNNDGDFSFKRLYLQLITAYELYDSGNYKESFQEIESLVRHMDLCTFNESDKQYIDAFNHIIRSTYAYIALSINIDYSEIIENVKLMNILNEVDRAAICAVKASIFMEYPPKGNDIALTFADQAYKFNSKEHNWALIWLKAKGRFRRYYYGNQSMPDVDEIKAADMLCTEQSKAQFLIEAFKIYYQVTSVATNQSILLKYYKLTLDLSIKAVELIEDNDVKKLKSCLFTLIQIPSRYTSQRSQRTIEEIVGKLKKIKCGTVNEVLGEYYLRVKDYEEAKIYFTRGMSYGYFKSAMKLLKVEFLLKPNSYPLAQKLNNLYEVFLCPKRRLIILSLLLLQYTYENNAERVMHYLKLYMDQDIDNELKKYHLYNVYPINKLHYRIKNRGFLNVLSDIVTNYTKLKWSTEEKTTIDDTFNRFNELFNVNIDTANVRRSSNTSAQTRHY